MYKGRKIYGYYSPIGGETAIMKVIDSTNKSVERIGFCLGLMGIAGIFLYKKVKDLSTTITSLKREVNKFKGME